jgi:glycosyltransferase involved in cell wall biosynthesis
MVIPNGADISLTKSPKVSVCVITYNHERYIADCLLSIVNQEANFDFEVIVGVDRSTDNTAAIVKEFETKYPTKIRAIFHSDNLNYGCNNYRITHLAAVGEYIAHIDGDDVMLPRKLQAQFDFLNKNPNCSIVAHKAQALVGNVISLHDGSVADQPVFSDIYRLLNVHMFFTHSSKMYRRSANRLDSCINEDYFIDYGLHVEHASWGPIGFINEPYVLYRRTPSSNSQVKGDRLYMSIDLTLDVYRKAVKLGLELPLLGKCFSKYAFKSAFFLLGSKDFIGFQRYMEVAVLDEFASPSLTQKLLYKLAGYDFSKRMLAQILLPLKKILVFLRKFMR